MLTTNSTPQDPSRPVDQPSPAEIARQRRAFIQKLVEIRRKEHRHSRLPHAPKAEEKS